MFVGDIIKSNLDNYGIIYIFSYEDSVTFVLRSFAEILACYGLDVTTPELSVERLFVPYYYTMRSAEEAEEMFGRLKRDALSARKHEMAAAGTEHVSGNWTWLHRLRQIFVREG
jgi:hypothetical protein